MYGGGDGYGGYGPGGGMGMHIGGGGGGEWEEMRALPVGAVDGEPVASVAFDEHEELLWSGTESGLVMSHVGPELGVYTSFHAHAAPVTCLLPDSDGVFSISHSSLRYHTKGGHMLLDFAAPADMQGLSIGMSSRRPQSGNPATASLSKVLLGGINNESLFLFDVNTARTLKQVSVSEAGISSMARGSRVICCGSGQGEVSLHDPSTLRLVKSLSAHTGGVHDIAVKNDLLVTCGWSQRAGTPLMDPLLHVYDLRTYRQLPPLSFPSGPVLMRFLPKLSSTLLVAAQSGAFQLVDYANGGMGGVQYLQVDMMNGPADMLTCLDVSQSGDCVCFGDTSGVVHHWTARDGVTFNDFSRPTEIPDYAPPPPPVQLPFSGDLSMMPLPLHTDGEALLSDWPETLTFGVRQHHPIPDSILSQLKQKDFVGYATNTGANKLRRNQAQPQLAPVYPSPVQLLADTEQQPTAPSNDAEEEPSQPKTPKKRLRPPKRYRVNQVNLSRLDNDQSSAKQYNKTELGSLEYTQPESYCNALLLALYNVTPLRVYCTNHLCHQEFCVTCELGFLFHMLNIAEGRNCHSSNVIRAIRMVPGSDDAGILIDDSVETAKGAAGDAAPSFAPSHWRTHSSTAFTHILERFARFLFSRLHLESHTHTQPAYESQPRAEPVRIVEELFGFECKTSSQCLSCGHEVGVEPARANIVSLGYPSLQETGHSNPSFATLLRKSLCGEFDLMDEDGMCPECGTYQPIHRTREVCTLPHKLCILANVNEERMQFWRPRQDDLTDSPSRGPSGVSSSSWFPSKLRISLDTSSKPSKLSIQELAGSHATQHKGVYRLTALVCNVHDHNSSDLEREHFVTFVHRRASEGDSSTKPQWFLMNDVIVSKVPEREVMSFSEEWKVPAVMVYELVTAADESVVKPMPTIEPLCPITKDVFAMKSPFKQRHEQKDVDVDNLPGKGDLVALDAEFVWVGPREPTMQEVAQHAPGRVDLSTPNLVALSEQRVKRPGRFSLARVSVISASSPECVADTEFSTVIDDYIATQDVITDYLTRFSGIVPGDLDPETSPHHITTLKHAYVRLRYLVDVGCKFVGHGLAKDFRMINILVPRPQVVDTVLLFHRRQQRMIKLRFLASFLLDVDIQSETHCSVEDAHTALRLYQRYLELSEGGEFSKVLEEIYRVGRECHWDIGCLSPEDRARTVALSKAKAASSPDSASSSAAASDASAPEDAPAT